MSPKGRNTGKTVSELKTIETMNLQEYLNQTEPQYKPIVLLEPTDYTVLSEYTLAGQTGKIILIPAIQALPESELSGTYELRPGETVLRTDKGNKSCFYIISPSNHISPCN